MRIVGKLSKRLVAVILLGVLIFAETKRPSTVIDTPKARIPDARRRTFPTRDSPRNCLLTSKKCLFFCVLQREARGSVTFKIVPSYRSAPPPCEVQVSPKNQAYSQSHTTTITTNTTTATASTSLATLPSSAAAAASSGNSKSVKTQTSKDLKVGKSQKAPKLKIGNASSSETSTPIRRRLNPLSVLRSRKSKS